MTTVIWSTESVDTSATFLSQGLDDTLFTKSDNDNPNVVDEVITELKQLDTRVVFYGAVKLPEWFEDIFDKDRMFNDPRNTRKLLKRDEVMRTLRNRGVTTTSYRPVTNESTFTSLCEHFGGRKLDLVVKTGMTVVSTVTTAAEFNAAKANVHYACAHSDPGARYRAFVGAPEITNGGILGALFSENRKLTFKETLGYGSGMDVRQHIDKLFAEGTLTEDMGDGQKAWTEESYVSVENWGNDNVLAQFRNIADVIIDAYGVDFCSVDGVVLPTGTVMVTNVTASPSLQNEDVLHAVCSYFDLLLTTGRKVTKDKLLDMVKALSEKEVEELGKLLMKKRAA